MGENQDKVVIVGAGLVGSTCAYALLLRGIATQIVLIDIDQERLQGEVMDLNHGISFVPPCQVRAGSYADCADASIAIICAGANQTPGQSRMALVDQNAHITAQIVREIVRYNDRIILLMVTNPVDILTYAAWKVSGFDRRRVLGSGTVLDTARLRYTIARQCGVDAGDVNAYIVGEHGDSEVALWSSATIAGLPIRTFCRECGKADSEADHAHISREIQQSAYRIIAGKGATYYAVGLAVSEIVRTILRDQHSVLPVCSVLEQVCGYADVSLSVPCLIDRAGIQQVLPVPMDQAERDALAASAGIIQEGINCLSDL